MYPTEKELKKNFNGLQYKLRCSLNRVSITVTGWKTGLIVFLSDDLGDKTAALQNKSSIELIKKIFRLKLEECKKPPRKYFR